MAEPRTVRENANALNSEQIAACLLYTSDAADDLA